MNYLTVSWQTYHKLIYQLSEKIAKKKDRFDLIVAIARGGLTVAHILSDFNRLPITSFTISSYSDLKQSTNPKITLHLGNKLHNKKILLVDDVSDTGKTFIRGLKYLKTLGGNYIKTASIFVKPKTKFIPDYFVKKTDKWIIFPHDMKETIDSLKKKHSNKELISFGLSKYFVDKYTN